MNGFIQHIPILMVAVIFSGAVLVPVVFMWKKGIAVVISGLALLLSLGGGVAMCGTVVAEGVISYSPGSWQPPFGIEMRIDMVALAVAILISAVSLVVVIYSYRYAHKEMPQKSTVSYYCLLLLLAGSMTGLAFSGDIFNLFVFFEILSIASYALVAVKGTGGATRAALKYLLVGAPGSIIVLLAIGYLYSATGTLNMADIAAVIQTSAYDRVILIAFVLFVTGFGVKAALFPLHVWLPDAHGEALSPVSAVLSGLVVKMGLYSIFRLVYSVYTTGYSTDVNRIGLMLSWLGGAAIIYGASMAIRQKLLKRMMAYSTIANVGYIMLGIGLANMDALTGSIYHVMAHSVAKACFFICAGSIIYRSGYHRIDELKGAARKMPLTAAAFTIAALSLVGIPPTAGFISKWYLILGSLASGNIALAVAILLGSVMAAVYCFRVVYYMFFMPAAWERWQHVSGDAPALMTGSSMVLAVAALVLGTAYGWIVPGLRAAVGLLL